jgi:ribonuclease Z
MKYLITSAIAGLSFLAAPVFAANCIEVTITGVQGGPPVFAGQAGSGTLVT